LSLRETLQLAHDLVAVASARLLTLNDELGLLVFGKNALIDAVLAIEHPLGEQVPTSSYVLALIQTGRMRFLRGNHSLDLSRVTVRSELLQVCRDSFEVIARELHVAKEWVDDVLDLDAVRAVEQVQEPRLRQMGFFFRRPVVASAADVVDVVVVHHVVVHDVVIHGVGG
jgi:hypothetical protein